MKGQPVPGSRHRRSARTAALALCGALTLGACGSADEAATGGSDATALIVDGREFTVGEIQESSRELSAVIAAQASNGQPQEFGPDRLAGSLVQVPVILEYAEANGLAVPTEAAVEKQLDEVVPSPSPTTVDFFRANVAFSQLSPEQQEEVVAKVEAQDVTISPRYRGPDDNPNWLKVPEEVPFEMP